MANGPSNETATSTTLGSALAEYLNSLKPAQRYAQENYVRHFVGHMGDQLTTDALSGSRVESYAESTIRAADPAAPERVAALKAWFQFLRKRNYTTSNFGVNIRARRPAGGRSASAASRLEEPPIELTAEGLSALQHELAEVTGQMPELVHAITLAREDKDFRENAPLDAAREALAFNDQRRKQIEATLKRAVVVEHTRGDLTAVGSSVTVTRLDNSKSVTYMLVSAREANAGEQKISVDSPVGRELLGRRPGDEVTVKVPSGEIRYRIDSISQA